MKKNVTEICENFTVSFGWVVSGVLTGLILGAVGAVFSRSIGIVTEFRIAHPLIIWLLPLAGLVIAFLYEKAGKSVDGGTNLIIQSLLDGKKIPILLAPLIFISTVLTHLFGGSAGREGAALQLGGSIGQGIFNFFCHTFSNNLQQKNKKIFSVENASIMTMAGMAGAFSALFGTPFAACFFAMEVSRVGKMRLEALIACASSSLSAFFMATFLGSAPERFEAELPEMLTSRNLFSVFLLCVLCAAMSRLFCFVMHSAEHLYQKFLKNPYIRIAAGGLAVALLSFIIGPNLYNGAGLNVVELALEGEAPLEACIMKMLFTALTLGAGYKGGEIVPTL